MITRSGSGRSAKEETYGEAFWRLEANLRCMTCEGAGASHGSRTMENESDSSCSDVKREELRGRKVRRKEASPLSCLMVTDILVQLKEYDFYSLTAYC